MHSEVFALAFTLGVRAVSAKATLESPALGQKGEGELQMALPALGVVGILHPFPVPVLKSFALSARLAGGTIVGYRYFHAEGENDGDEAEVDLSGPYASVTLTF